jgi:hypothetical protein
MENEKKAVYLMSRQRWRCPPLLRRLLALMNRVPR